MSVFDRERADNMYSALAYLISWLFVNLTLYGMLAILFSAIVYYMSGLRTDGEPGYHFGIFAATNILMQWCV
jgi:ABC-type multidrug transport system permease subunit